MADNAQQIGIRVNDETKNLFDDLSRKSEFKNNGEFLTHLLVMYQAEQIKEVDSVVKPAIEAAQTLMSRLIEILIGVEATITMRDEKSTHELNEQRNSFEQTRALLQQRITVLKNELAESKAQANLFLEERDAAKSKASELSARVSQLENSIIDKDSLISAGVAKYNSLNDMFLQYKGFADENKELNDALHELTHDNDVLKQKLDGYNNKIRMIEADSIKEQEFIRNSLALEKDAALVKKDAAMVELQSEFQKKYEEQQARYNKSITEYEFRVKELLDMLTVAAAVNRADPI